ncbi:MAG: LacI family DNA-binding transcriptional regulator [Luteolibacter sp.]
MINSIPNQNITQRDIARASGVSNATVSLALRNSELLTKERCQEIQDIAQRMGYRPNPAAAELSRHKKNSKVAPTHAALAWINAWQPAEKLRSYRQFDFYWKGAEEAARKLGYHLEEFQLNNAVTPDRLHRILDARGIRGILLPPHPPQNEWTEFPWDCYSIVRFGRSLKNPASHIVSSDQVSNAMVAFARMRDLGYKRIGFMTNEDEMAWKAGHLSEAGFLMAQRMVPTRERIPICVVGELSNSGRAQLVAEWVRKHRIDAILSDSSQCPEILTKAHLRVPDDIGLACTNILDIPITAGINQNPAEIGRAGLLMLHSLITDNARGIPPMLTQMLVQGTWIDGGCLPPKT